MSCRYQRPLIRPFQLPFVTFVVLLITMNITAACPDELANRPSASYFDEDALRISMLADGVSPAAVQRLLEQHRLLLLQGRNPAVRAFTKYTSPNHGCTTCDGIGVENGWSGWQGLPGINSNTANGGSGGLSFSPAGLPSAPRFEITAGNGIDAMTPGLNPGDPVIPVVAPGFGNHSIRLGELYTAGYGAERLVFPFTVGISDTSFIYSYAFVMENPSNITPPHDDENMPYVEFMILDDQGDTVDCAYRRYQANESFPGQYSCNGPAQGQGGIIPVYKPWTNVGVNLSAYVGRNLTVVITNADCQLGGHFAYSYWDFSCGAIPSLVNPNCNVNVPDTLSAPISEPGNPYAYRWYKNQDPAIVGTTQTIMPYTTVGDTFKVEITTIDGCRWYMLYVPQHYGIEGDFNFTRSCADVTFSDASLSQIPGQAIVAWEWLFNGSSTTTSQSRNPGSVHFTPGVHDVRLIVTSSGGCSDTVERAVSIPAPPEAAFEGPPVCLGNSTPISNLSSAAAGDPIVAYTWSLPGGTPDVSSIESPVVKYSTAGSHAARMIAFTQSGCVDTAEGQLFVFRPPHVAINAGEEGCAPLCHRFEDFSTAFDDSISNWSWSFPGGIPSASAAARPGDICYSNPGNYTATLTVTTEHGCISRLAEPAVITAHPKPTADFIMAASESNGSGALFNYIDQSSANVVQWNWDFGDGTILDASCPIVSHDYSEALQTNDFYSFETRLYVTTRYGCVDTVSKKVFIEPDFEFFIPTAFTPDGNDLNSSFYGKGRGIKEYEMFIFDRWGLEIWSCEASGSNISLDKEEGMPAFCKWDGMYKGQKVQQDVYVWLVRIRDIFGRQKSYTGRVSVVY